MTAQQFKLGWQPGPPDPRTLKLGNYTTPDQPKPPGTLDWMSKVERWPVLGNDRIGDCVLVSCAHLVQGWTMYADGAEVCIPERDVVDAYAKVTGYNPQTGDGDNGTRTLDAFKFWRKTGIGGRRIAAYLQVDHHDDDAVRNAASTFGGLFVAAQLPRSATVQFDQGKTWTPTRGPAGRRGSLGGHAMHLGGYNKTGFVLSTWGRTQRATWGFWDTYISEAWAVVSPDWLNTATGNSPLGFNLEGLLADLRRVTA